MNNIDIARAIALAAIAGEFALSVEDVDHNQAPYQGVLIGSRGEFSHRGVHIYLCDDDRQNPVWMMDATDADSGDVNPMPLTGEALTMAVVWLLGRAALRDDEPC